MPGEAMHQLGAEGTRRAKKWLDATTRVTASWTNEDAVHASRLEFDWPHGGQKFSFDLGGILAGGDYEGHFFLAESKKYSSDSDQGNHFDDWLAKCYVSRQLMPGLSDHFMWITWHPFRVTTWTKLPSTETIEAALVKNRKRLFDTDDAAAARAAINSAVVADVSSSIWLVVLSDKQETLVISDADRGRLIALKMGGVSL